MASNQTLKSSNQKHNTVTKLEFIIVSIIEMEGGMVVSCYGNNLFKRFYVSTPKNLL